MKFDDEGQDAHGSACELQAAPGYLLTGWTNWHREADVAKVIAESESAAAMTHNLSGCLKVRELFSSLVSHVRALKEKYEWPVAVVKLEVGVGLMGKEHGRIHYHVYVGMVPASSGYLSAEDFCGVAKTFDPSVFSVGGFCPNVRRCATRNGKGVNIYIEGAIYYCLANKVGSLLSDSQDIVLWQDVFAMGGVRVLIGRIVSSFPDIREQI